MKKRFFSIICVALFVFTSLVIPVSAAGAEGASFTADRTFTMENRLDGAPLTYEAVIKLPAGYSGRGGVIIGNYSNSSTKAVSFEIYENGVPRIYTITGNGKAVTNIGFSEVNVATGEYVHLAFTVDPVNSKVRCYLNGEFKGERDLTNYTQEALVNNLMVGGDMRSGNAQYFKGNIKSVAIYSDVRTAAEILSDSKATAPDTTDSGLLAAYDLTAVGSAHVADASNNKNTLVDSTLGYETLVTAKGGMTFDKNTMYVVDKPFDKAPTTFEAWAYLPQLCSGRAGVILGNYESSTPSFSMEIAASGAPRLYYTDADGDIHDITFSSSDIRTGDWAHIALVIDADNKTVYCYIDGELSSTVTEDKVASIDTASFETRDYALGCDMRTKNERFFMGALKSVSVYSDIRTAAEIKADMTAVSLTDEALMAHYDMTGLKKGDDIADKSPCARNASYGQRWFEEKDAVTNYAYSFCVVGDTQIVAYRDPTNFHKIYDWILSNKTSKKIEYVFGLGDITDRDTDTEWELAKENISKLNGVVPYSVVRGNHDGTNQINKYFANDTYMDQFGGFYADGKIENSWRTLKVGNTDYLLITLDYGASDAVLNWAGGIIENHPDHKVIITTHAYFFRDGTTLDQNDVCPPKATDDDEYNNGDHMWDKLISKHENIVLVMSGHDPAERVVMTQTAGKNGNTVTQLLVDPQGLDKDEIDAGNTGTGMITMLYFSADGETVTVETYSTIRDEYFRADNQFTIDLAKELSSTPDNDGGNSGGGDGGSGNGGSNSGGNNNGNNGGGSNSDGKVPNNGENSGSENDSGKLPAPEDTSDIQGDKDDAGKAKGGLIASILGLGTVATVIIVVAAVLVVAAAVAVPIIVIKIRKKKK